jgi:hypothetical protein
VERTKKPNINLPIRQGVEDILHPELSLFLDDAFTGQVVADSLRAQRVDHILAFLLCEELRRLGEIVHEEGGDDADEDGQDPLEDEDPAPAGVVADAVHFLYPWLARCSTVGNSCRRTAMAHARIPEKAPAILAALKNMA